MHVDFIILEVVLGFPDVLRNRRSEVLKNFKKLSENGRKTLCSELESRLRLNFFENFASHFP
jgi:hypothetical protein